MGAALCRWSIDQQLCSRSHPPLPCSKRARALAHAVDTDVAVVKRLGSIAAVQHHHELMPILHPQEDNLPFAMSLERVHGSHAPHNPCPPAADQCPMCEVLYVLQGAGRVHIDAAPTGEVVRSGDSILAPAGSVQVQPLEESDDEDEPGTTFLRVVLPLRFALGERDAAELVSECSCAAQQVRAAACCRVAALLAS